MSKKECKDGKCKLETPNLRTKDIKNNKVDKKDSSKRLR